MQTSDRFPIIRDRRYEQTYRRDMRRQKIRRAAHNIASAYERRVWWPRWEGVRMSGQKLSTCIITMNSEHRIVPLLKYIRAFSDEIVVGVDGKTMDNTLAVCEGLADELFVIENEALTCNSGLEALVSRCHGDWVLRLDDDEFPEPHFMRIRHGLMASRRYTHYKFPRMHLAHADPETRDLTWINDGYLYPDFQMRLFRNDPELLSFPGAVGHSSIQCEGLRGKVNTVNLVHLNMAVNPRFKREEKLEKYIARLDGGWVHPVNEHALLFEDFHYRIEPYRYADAAFVRLMAETTLTQRRVYEDTRQEAVIKS